MRLIIPTLAVLTLLIPRAAAPAIRTTGLSRQQRQQPIADTLQVYSRETFVDVVVTDSQGHSVHGLTQSDFTVLEDGKPIPPKSFEEHRTDLLAPAPAALPAKLDLGSNTFTNFTATPPAAGPLNILLLDSLNTGTQVQKIIIQRMLDYVDKMASGTRFAVLRLSTSLSLVQGFTTDREILKAAITNKKNLWAEPPLADPGSEKGLQPPIFVDPGVAIEKEGNASGLRGEYEMSAMRQLARYLSGLPGRKNLIWFAGSFPLKFPPVSDPIIFPPPGPSVGARDNQVISDVYDFKEEMKAATDMLARSHTAVYPIDGRGVEPLRPGAGLSGLSNGAAMRIGEQETMELIADRTGGHAFYNTNGLTEAVQQAVEDGSNFYTITYTPTNQALDTRFRKIAVKVARPGLHLTYREGYYAVDPAVDSRGKKVLPNATPMQSALLRGAPEPTEIIFKARVLTSTGTDDSLPVTNRIAASPVAAKSMHPPLRHFTVWYAAGIRNVQFATTADGARHGSIELTILVYNPDGEIVNSATTILPLNLNPTQYAGMLKTGVITRQDIATPAIGDFTLRIAVHDRSSNRVGAVEVPTSAIHSDAAPALAAKP